MHRNIELDMARALCALYIVCFLHLQGYSPLHRWFSLEVMSYIEQITSIALGCFTFISGLFLGKKGISSKADILYFYKRRLSRFYLMFFVAITSIYILSKFGGFFWFPSFKYYIVSLFGLSCFTFNPPTFWFIEMLIMFYLATPIILYIKKKSSRFALVVSIYAFFLICHYFHHMDFRVLVYYPVYIIGMITPLCWIERIKKNKNIVYGILSLPIFIISIMPPHYWSNVLFDTNVVYKIWLVLIGTFVIIMISSLLCKFSVVGKIGSWLAYISMAAYLFHRHIYYFFTLVENSFTSWWFDMLAALAVVFLSYFIQKEFDKIKL